MILEAYDEIVNDARLAPGTNTLFGDVIPINLNLIDALEEILVVVTVTMDSSAPASLTLDGLLSVLKKVSLTTQEGDKPFTRINYPGIGLLELGSNVGLNLDRSTLGVIEAHLAASYAASGVYRICYRIPIVHPLMQEPLRTRCLLPLRALRDQPLLTLEFAASTDVCATNPPAGLVAEVVLCKRRMNQAALDGIVNDGGFLLSDLIETPFNLATGVSGEVEFKLPTRGHYMNLQLRHYLGGASVTRADISANTTAGTETVWRIQSGGDIIRKWRNKHTQIKNDFSRPMNRPYGLSLFSTGAPITTSTGQTSGTAWVGSKAFIVPGVLAGALATGLNVQAPASINLDFMTDGNNDANELGSLLDAEGPARSGANLSIFGEVASAATNGSSLYVGGYRLFGNLDRWRVAKKGY